MQFNVRFRKKKAMSEREVGRRRRRWL